MEQQNLQQQALEQKIDDLHFLNLTLLGF